MTARVIVNRLWQKHFGRGIVATLENFGKMGEPPTHPELLDWLAVEFMKAAGASSGSTKLMMMSEAYQMASAFDDAGDMRNDPENHYLWRFRPQRLEAEIVRDNMLAVGGNINLDVGGEPIFPFIPKDMLAGQYRGKWVEHAGRARGVAAGRVRLSATLAAVSDVRHVRSSRHERHGGRAARVDGADAGAHAVEQSVRAVARRQFFAARDPPAGERPGGAGRRGVSDRAGAAARRRRRSRIGDEL